MPGSSATIATAGLLMAALVFSLGGLPRHPQPAVSCGRSAPVVPDAQAQPHGGVRPDEARPTGRGIIGPADASGRHDAPQASVLRAGADGSSDRARAGGVTGCLLPDAQRAAMR
jgi:hypothetical protein